MIRIGKHPDGFTVKEVNAYFKHANEMYPNTDGTVDIEIDGEYVDLKYTIKVPCDIPFQRIRRITGYLVGDLSRFNNAKLEEVHDRVKHSF